jgi:hypothetical protein
MMAMYSTVRALRPQEGVENEQGDERSFECGVRPHMRYMRRRLSLGHGLTLWRGTYRESVMSLAAALVTWSQRDTQSSWRFSDAKQLQSLNVELVVWEVVFDRWLRGGLG